jgi:CheY-like chemotaxis protein
VTAVSTGEEALQALDVTHFECVIVDLGLPDISGVQLIERIKAHPSHSHVPIIVYTGRELTRDEDRKLRSLSESIIIKGSMSPQRLIDETAFFLHKVDVGLKKPGSAIFHGAASGSMGITLIGKRILIVDDDARNIVALRAALEAHQLNVVAAESGQEGIVALSASPENIDVVLMDIMMPELDGYETIRRIRAMPRFASLPIIALTAKAMKGDRETCIAAGASDYISKPVDVDQLLSLIRVWLSA